MILALVEVILMKNSVTLLSVFVSLMCVFLLVGCSGEQVVDQAAVAGEDSAMGSGADSQVPGSAESVPVEEGMPPVEEQAPVASPTPVAAAPVVAEVDGNQPSEVQPVVLHECGVLKAGKYVLGSDISASGHNNSVACFSLSSDTTLNCNEHKIYKTGLDNGYGIGIQAKDSHDVMITHCEITNFYDGIDVVNSRNVVIHFNTVSSHDRDGIRLFDGTDLRVENNVVQGNVHSGLFLNTSMEGRSWEEDVFVSNNTGCSNAQRDYQCLGNYAVGGEGNRFERVMPCRDSNAWPIQEKGYLTCHDHDLPDRHWR